MKSRPANRIQKNSTLPVSGKLDVDADDEARGSWCVPFDRENGGTGLARCRRAF